MSLVSDPDFLIHSLRLNYLRNVDDPYGARVMSLNPAYASNPYIIAASFADTRRWPELNMPHSPHVSDDEGEQGPHSRGATGLRYTQTIMGPSRSGALGLRTSGRRAPKARHVSPTPRQINGHSILSEQDVQADPNSVSTLVSTALGEHGQDKAMEETDFEQPTAQALAAAQPLADKYPAIAPKEVVFIPRFKGAAEMEARRKMRMQARRQHTPVVESKSPTSAALSNPAPSSFWEEVISTEEEDSFDDLGDGGSGIDDGDEFDPDFAVTRTPGANSGSASESLSVNSATSMSNSSAAHPGPRVHRRPSPASEGKSSRNDSHTHSPRKPSTKSTESGFEMLTAPPESHKRPESREKENHPDPDATAVQPPQITFARRPVPPLRPVQSSLTAMLASSGGSANPFSELYGAISGRAEAATIKVTVFFPHARESFRRPMELSARKDATVEEIIGLSLWTYWEQGWLPRLDEGLSGEEDPKWVTRLSAVGWIMRIAEEDGEVDDEFPSPDRTGRISKFNFDAYAVLEANPSQIAQNKILESKIQRRPSRTMTAKKPAAATANGSTLTVPSTSGLSSSLTTASTFVSVSLSPLGPSSALGPLMFLRIKVADTADAVHVSTTIPVSAGTYMQEALETVCRKRKFTNPNDYALMLEDMSVLIPLDRTVQSLEGQNQLVLIKRSMLPSDVDLVKSVGKTTDPNASIFKRISDIPAIQHSSPVDVTAAYKKYTIFRKVSMLARAERTLAIDGGYVYVMPSTSRAKAVFDSGKTTSYHIQSIVGCLQSTKSSSIFKLDVERDHVIKRYDFEAESPKHAGEIVQTIRALRAAWERSSTATKSRRSRQVV